MSNLILQSTEYFGVRTYANSAEQNYQAQYDYYKAGNSKIHYKHNATGTAAFAHCRSANSGETSFFCRAAPYNNITIGYSDDSFAIAPCFFV